MEDRRIGWIWKLEGYKAGTWEDRRMEDRRIGG